MACLYLKQTETPNQQQQNNLWSSPWDSIFLNKQEIYQEQEISALDLYHLILKEAENSMSWLHLRTSLHQILPRSHANTSHTAYWIFLNK